MKHLLYFLALTLLFTSCVSTEKYASFIEAKTSSVSHTNPDWLVVNAPPSEQTGNRYNQLKYFFIPAILYWGWNSTIECQIDPQVTTNYFRASIQKAAESYDLQNKLNGRQLVINLNEVPGKFVFERKGFALILMVAYATNQIETITPFPISLTANYHLKADGVDMANGQTEVLNTEQPLRNIWKSSRKFTWMYLQEYRKETDRMAQELVKQIVSDLEG